MDALTSFIYGMSMIFHDGVDILAQGQGHALSHDYVVDDSDRLAMSQGYSAL